MPSQNWTRTLFEAIDDCVFVHDEHGRILDANPAACRRLGYTRDELLTLTTRDIDAPEFAAGFTERLATQKQAGRMRCEGVHRTKDGRRIIVDINTSAIQLEGKPAVLAVSRDITERKQTEEALSKQSQLLQSILDSMSDAIAVADAQERIVLFNPMAEHIFGPGLLQGLFLLYQADQTTRLRELPIARCVRGESFDGLELFVRHEEAPAGLWISVAGRPLRERSGAIKGGVIVCQDITDRKRHERQAEAQYEVARVLAADRDFAATVTEVLQILCKGLEFEAGIVWQALPEKHAYGWLEGWHVPHIDVESLWAMSQTCLLDASALRFDADLELRRAEGPDAPWLSPTRWLAARQAGFHQALALPIRSGQETVGLLEFWRQRADGDDDTLLATLQSITHQLGQYLDRQRVEKELRDSRALYESLVESLPQNIFRKDRQSRVTFGNARYCDSLHRPLQELLGKTDFDLFPAETALKYVRDDQGVMESGQPVDTIEEHFLPDGKKLYVHVVKTPVYNAEGEVIGVQGIFWDVTQEVLAHQAVAHSERRYRQLTEATMDGIVLIDADGKIALFNPAAERMFGWKPDEMLGRPAHTLIPEAFPSPGDNGQAALLPRRFEEMLGRPLEFKARHKSGEEFPVEIALSALRDPADPRATQLLAAVRDLTERNKMRSILVQNEKLASIGLLSAGVAHEINNPLAFVANNLVVLERDCQAMLSVVELYRSANASLDAPTAERIQTLAEEMDLTYVQQNMMRILSRTRDGIERVTRIVHSLRGMARTEAPRRQDARIPDMINSSLEILHGKFKRLGVVIEQRHDPNPVVPCVPTQISQVILNVLVNAFQAIESARRSNGHIVIRTERQGGEMLLEIRDNGPGIDPGHLPRVFDPFFTTKDVGEGTGLGLSISHHIVSAHGGRIEVDSKVGEGTSFRIYLPLK